MSDKTLDQVAIDTIRTLSMDGVQAANSGHPGAPMGQAALGWALWSRLRKHDPNRPDWVDRDRFILSCGHASMLQYSLLHLCGYDLSLDELKKFRQWGSKTPGHPEYGHTVGVETTTGPLGQGFANGVGMAMAEKHMAERFNRPGHTVVDHRTWVIASDGDIMEGVCAEAASLAGHLKLGKLVVFWDDNRITIDGRTDKSFTEDVCKRFESYGWQVLHVEDGNDIEAIEKAGREAMADSERPTFIQTRTVIGYPSPAKQDTSASHGAPLGPDEVSATKKVMGVRDAAFVIPDEIDSVRQSVVARGADASAAWDATFKEYAAAHADLATALQDAAAGKLPSGWDKDLPAFDTDEKGLATRKASGEVIQALAGALGGFVGGSADLAGSNNSDQKGLRRFGQDGEGAPRNVDWGIREHAMASAVNGMALHGGVIPYSATFLVFADYMRPALRLAALMNLPTRHIFTHDSIGLGEDGPTHQPIEHLSSLRAIPNFTVIRPADANEVREAWKVAISLPGPAALVLTRQNVPTLDRSVYGGAEGLAKGGYVLAEADGGEAQAILVATGSEVSIALEAREKLQAAGVRTRLVSMPSTELFEAQDANYQASVLPDTGAVRVVVEAGVRHGWDRWIGPKGGYVTIETFGASAPYETLYEKYGLTADNVVKVTQSLL